MHIIMEHKILHPSVLMLPGTTHHLTILTAGLQNYNTSEMSKNVHSNVNLCDTIHKRVDTVNIFLITRLIT